MSATSSPTDDIFTAFLKCRHKAHLQIQGAAGDLPEYQQLQTRLAAGYRLAAQREMLRGHDPGSVVVSPSSLADAVRGRAALIFDAAADDADGACRFDALERTASGTYIPILFRHHRVTADDRLRLAYGAAVLGRVSGGVPDHGRIVHGPQFRPTRVSLPTLAGPVRDALDQIRAIRESATPPPLVLNRHCPECEFRRSCRAAAVAKDDLSLLRGLPAKEIAGLNSRGIFTVTQFSHTFRPGRLKRVEETGARHEHALQALAVREKKVYIARRPKLPDGTLRAYLDVEGLPDRDFYYLIGLSVEDGTGVRRSSFWADREADERTMWAAFLEAAGGLGKELVLYHYGSYETHFLDRMRERHGGDPEILARLKTGAVNVLSAVHAQVYFPTHANDLKSVAGCLGFRWSEPEASGLQSIVWRHAWEESGDPAMKERLLTYNREDVAALELVTAAVRSLGAESPPAAAGGVSVGGLEDIKGPGPRTFGQATFAVPEFAGITKRAYFDYQRDKVLCRTNPEVRKSLRRRKKRTRKPTYRINQEIECGRPSTCPHCGGEQLKPLTQYQKLVVDLKPFRGGVKRWVTRYKTKWYRCQVCWQSCIPSDYPDRFESYGRGLHAWVIYSSIAHRQTNESIAEILLDQFGVLLASNYASRIRGRAVEYYRPTYESLLSTLRSGPVVYADETKVRLRRPTASGYVWVFASPATAAYIYAPTREGTTVQDTLTGFQGVLVSDFYSAYDSMPCPQQKCLIHLIRDLNEDLLKNPFDEGLKQIAARFTAVLQPVIATIDRFGLTKHHLGKHKTAVDRFFVAESAVDHHSEVAKHYQTRFLKNREKLFTFLNYDGVAWNNNNAENAVKLFAIRRSVLGVPFTTTGIQNYLVLLSLYQTLRYRNLSFWKFLLSGETDLAAYTAKCR